MRGRLRILSTMGPNIKIAKGGQSTQEHLIEAMNIAGSFKAEY
jgi:hypothetical protein